MEISDAELGSGDPATIALTILRTLEDRAFQHAEAQRERCSSRPDLVDRWTAIIAAMRTLAQVDAHLQIALDLLDTLDVSIGTPHIDAAIVSLGLRPPNETAFQIARDDAYQGREYYGLRAQQHLDAARREPDLIAKGRHLDLASRFATLGELVERAGKVAQAASPQPDAGPRLNGHPG